MAYGARRWLIGLGAVAAAWASVLGQAGVAGAATTAPAASAAPGASTAGASAGVSATGAARFLHLGSHGPAVKALQQRLTALHYYLGRIDGKFGWNTMEAVWAFKEVQFRKRIPPKPDIVGSLMWRQLKHPRTPRVLKPRGGPWRVEINKNIGVLVLYRHDKVRLISHVSTAAYCRPDGCGWVTPDGKHHTLWFSPGWVTGPLGSMYNPVVFTPDGAYAIHGEPNPTSTISYDGVPLNPASHGCVRIPMDVSRIFHKLVHLSTTHGTPVYIFGRNR